jgi:hypothetical protein
MLMFLYCTELNLSKFNRSSVVYINQNTYFNVQPSTFVFLGFHKNNHDKSCSSFQDLSVYKIFTLK